MKKLREILPLREMEYYKNNSDYKVNLSDYKEKLNPNIIKRLSPAIKHPKTNELIVGKRDQTHNEVMETI